MSVFEVGEDAGRVYMAMELVHGDSLGHAAKRARDTLGWRGVAALFGQAGRGLAAAHEAGLVHRDFKPANAIVDDTGRVRVLDFGLARAFSAEPASGNVDTDEPEQSDGARGIPSPGADASARAGVAPTVAGVVVGTPVYMSPEQHVGEPLDARSDQFSFCVALFEGLYGQRPYAADGVPELVRKVMTGVPDPVAAEARVPAWLRRIVLRGLRPDPHARWDSMHALLRALDRGMDRRRPWALGVAGVAVVIAGVTYARASSLASPCAGLEGQLDAAWGDAQRRRLHDAIAHSERPGAASTWTSAEASLDRYAGDWTSMYTDACRTHQRGEQSDELYDLRVVCLDGRRDALEEVVNVLGDDAATAIDHAIPMTLRLPAIAGCADIEALTAEVALPDSLAERQQVVELRRQIQRVRALEQSERYDEGLALVEQLLASARALDYAPVLAEVQSWHGSLLEYVGRYSPAEAALTEGFFAALASGHDEYAVNTARMLIYLLAVRHGRHESAMHWGQLAQALLLRGRVSPRTEATYHSSMGNLHHERREFARAKQEMDAALAIYQRIHPADHPDTAITLGNIGLELQSMKDYAGARVMVEQALRMKERLLGLDSAAVASERIGLAYLLLDQKDAEAAGRIFEQARASYLAIFGPAHPDLAYIDVGLGRVGQEQGDLATAEAYWQRALGVRRELYGDEHVLVADIESDLADIEVELGRFAPGKQRLLRIARVYAATFGAGNPHQAFALLRLARLQRLEGDLAGANSTLQSAYGVATAREDPDPELLAELELRLGQLARMSGDTERASQHLDAAEAAIDRVRPERRSVMGPVIAAERAELLLAAGQAAAAQALLDPFAARLTNDLEPDDRAAARMVLARARVELGGSVDAEARRLATLAIDDLRAGHLPARADDVTQWLARDAPAP